MLATLGAIGLGIKSIYEWCSSEQTEQDARSRAKKYGLETYTDKWGKQRYTSTGRRKTTNDYVNELQNDLEKMRNDYNTEKSILETKQLNEIKLFKQKYESKIEVYQAKYDLSFEEYFYATHTIKLLYKYSQFHKFIDAGNNSLKKIVKFRRGCKIIEKDYI